MSRLRLSDAICHTLVVSKLFKYLKFCIIVVNRAGKKPVFDKNNILDII